MTLLPSRAVGQRPADQAAAADAVHPVSAASKPVRAEPAHVRTARRFLTQRHGYRVAGTAVLPQAAGSTNWTAVGPVAVNSLAYGLVSGRVSALAFDPSDPAGNHLYVGTTGGGLWASQNAAASTASNVVFTPITDNLSALANAPQTGLSIGAVSVQPGGTGVILVGLGDPNDALDSYYGAGLLRSADGGNTWALIEQSVDFKSGISNRDYSFVGEGFAGFAWSTTNVQLVVAAVSQAYQGTLVNAGVSGLSMQGLYYSQDSGASWHLARIADLNGQDVQGPNDAFALPDGNAATSVVWNPLRQVFVAAVRFHGYYQSSDGITWTRMADYPNGQPGVSLTAANCPTESGSVGVAGCPIFRGALSVNPQTGDTFAWTVDVFNQDQGIWQDECGLTGTGSASSCSDPTLNFGIELDTAALEVADNNGAATITNGDYNLALAAVPAGLGTGQDTLLFAGANDLWKCSLANSCVWRNTTNSTTCQSAQVGEYQHAIAWDTGNPLLMMAGDDSGLWRSADQVGETGSVCSATDASHWQNLNATLGSLAEVASLGQSPASAATMLAGLGANGFAGVVNAPATAGNWKEILGGEGGPVAVAAASNLNSWYANNAAGVAIFHCSSATLCTPSAFGTSPVIGESQVANDGYSMPYPAEFLLDALDPTQMLIGTCRVWRGPATGSGWSASNAISPILDGTGGTVCSGNGLIRSIGMLPLASGGEAIYVGMAGAYDGGGVVAGHVFLGILSASGTVANWTDLAFSPVTNSTSPFNAAGNDVSSIYVDPHDITEATVYVTVSAFASVTQPVQIVYRSTDSGAHWSAITSNLPNAPANVVLVDTQDASTVYVAMDTGVYVTRAVGTCSTSTCWAAYGTGLPLAPVTQLVETPPGAATQTLTAGTYGRGVWQIPLVTSGTTLTTVGSSPASLTFSSQTVGTTSAAQTITLRTTGTLPLTVSGILFAGTGASDFAETDTCTGASIAKNATCTVKVTFTPTQADSRAAQLVISANIAGGQLQLPVSGTGVATAVVSLLPATLSFGPQQVATTSATQTINVQNTGGAQVTISSITVSAPFYKASNTCSGSLAGGSACAVTVAFTPAQAGAAAGSFTIVDGVGTQTATLSGTGIAGPTDTLSTTSLTFAPTVVGQSSPPLTVQITNSGGLPLTAIGTSIAGSNGADFSATATCGGTLAAGSSCAVAVTFRPSVVKAETGTLIISDALRAQNVSLSGLGLKAPSLSVSPATAAFGSLQLGVASAVKNFTVTNTGGSPLLQPTFSVSGSGAASFAIGASTCGASLAAAATCTVAVTFQPAASGPVSASLTVSTASTGVASVSATLTGTGLTPPSIGVAPASIDLGPVAVGNSSGAFTVQITNTGQVAMTGLTFAVGSPGGASGAQSADFAISEPTDVPACNLSGATLNPAATCSVQVTFSPSVVGAETATLTASSSNAVPPMATVSLSGTGTATLLLQASPALLNFPSTAVGATSVPQTMTVSNIGRKSANSLALTVTGPYALQTSASTCKAGAKLSSGSFCSISLSFTPAVAGDQPGSLAVSISNLGIAPLSVPLDGTGFAVGGIAPTPTQMTFGSVVLKAASQAQTLTVTNSGQAALAGLSLKITGDFALTANTCSGTLAAGATCTSGVVFTPSATGSRGGTLTASSTSTAVGPAVVSLIGNGITAGSLTASPAVVSFGSVTAGQTGPAQTVTLTNAGATVLAGLQFQIAGDYSLSTNTCGTQISSGATCAFTAIFSPSQPGTRIGSVTVTSTNSGFAPFLVGLSGTGVAAAQLVVAPAQLSFGTVVVGTNSASQQLLVSNPGTGTLAGLSFSSAPPFSVGTGSCGATLVAGGSCGVPVTFTPTTAGAQTGMVNATSTSLGVSAVSVPVTGAGLAGPSLQVAPSSITFPPTTLGQKSSGQTVTVSNSGGLGLSGLALQFSGSASADYTLSASTCTATLAAGASCMATVTFAPTVAGGRTAFLTASSATAGVTPAPTLLNGTGLTAASLNVSPQQLVFGATLAGQTSATQTVVATNSGGTAITDLQFGVTTGFGVDAARTTCGVSLASGASCNIGVNFDPSSAGPLTGTLRISSAAGGTTANAALTGTGALPPAVITSPATLVQFGTTGLGQAAAPVQVTVTNQGTVAALTGLSLAIDANGQLAGFGLSNDTCTGMSLPAGASCTVNVNFIPSNAGRLSGSLVITSAAPPVSLALAGIGFNFTFYVIGSSSVTVTAGHTGYFTFGVTPLGLPAGTGAGLVSFTCGTLPKNALCLFNPPQLTGLKSTGNVTMGIGTGMALGANHPPSNKWVDVAIFACALVATPVVGRRRRRWHQAVKILILASLITGVTSCVGSGGSMNSGGQTNPGNGTPPGTYPIVATASSNGVVVSIKVTLIVN